MVSVLSKIRCRTDEIETLEVTFAADAAAGAFVGLGGNAYSRTVIGMALETVDQSVDAEGTLLFRAKKLVADRATWHSFVAGAKVYYDGTNDEFTGTGTDFMLAGIAIEDSAAGQNTVEISFDGSLLARAIT